MNRRRLLLLAACAVSAASAATIACGSTNDAADDTTGGEAGAGDGAGGTIGDSAAGGDGASGFAFPTPIHHLVIVVKENHTFDNFFGFFAENGETAKPNAKLSDGTTIVRPECPKGGLGRDLSHTHPSAVIDFNDGGMNGWDLLKNNVRPPDGGAKDYLAYCGFSDGNQANAYWTLARNFAMADDYHTTILGPSFPGHLATAIGQTPAYGNPGCPPGDDSCENDENPSGCVGPPTETVPSYNPDTCSDAGFVRPCWDLATWMDTFPPQLNWQVYAVPKNGGFDDAGAPLISTAFNAVLKHSTAAERSAHFRPDSFLIPQILEDTKLPGILANMPNVMFWDDGGRNSEHPPSSPCCGEQDDLTLVNAVMSGPNWKDTALLITFDDFGGFYDHVAPNVERCANHQFFSPGFRVPMIIVSPYAKKGFVLHDVTEQASVPRLIEELFGMPMTSDRDPHARDGKSGSLLGAFDFSQAPSDPIALPFTPSDCDAVKCSAFIPDE